MISIRSLSTIKASAAIQIAACPPLLIEWKKDKKHSTVLFAVFIVENIHFRATVNRRDDQDNFQADDSTQTARVSPTMCINLVVSLMDCFSNRWSINTL